MPLNLLLMPKIPSMTEVWIEAREVSRQEELAAELALNAKNTEYDRGLNVSNQNQAAWLAKQKNNAEEWLGKVLLSLLALQTPKTV